MQVYDRLPLWAKRMIEYAPIRLSPGALARSLELGRAMPAAALQHELAREYEMMVLTICAKSGKPLPTRPDGPIAEWSGLRTREARKGTHLRRGQP